MRVSGGRQQSVTQAQGIISGHRSAGSGQEAARLEEWLIADITNNNNIKIRDKMTWYDGNELK